MKHTKPSLFSITASLTLALLSPWHAHAAAPEARDFDIVVYGATAGGVMAATAAAQMGMNVALVDPGRHVGGMVSGGLSHTDVDRQENLIGGLTLKFFHRLAAHYGQASGWSFEPHVAEAEFRTMLQDEHVQLFPGEQVDRVAMKGPVIQNMYTAEGQTFSARIFIDSSYEGDLMKAAGVHYTVGPGGN